eukprot:TRINITY_DN100255_c0_g1_i1.p1 TRINITY_DN100255_c0_g1~~TRINITY_DN100255_c0_g1_i1.p1  ORF type:complete len:275 (+),score=48.60 TRINITY_DN100255_c0_g1_i1:61-885(+)
MFVTPSPKKRASEMTCEELRSELRDLDRKVTGTKAELRRRLDDVFQENGRGWVRRGQAVSMRERYLASGEFRHVYLTTYTKGPRKNQHGVEKVFKTGAVYESRFFDEDIKAVDKAADFVKAFNAHFEHYTVAGGAVDRVYLTKPEVWVSIGEDKQKSLVEPFLTSFRKFNSNTGWADNAHPLMQALSHFSYHHSDGACLLCDLQGEGGQDNYVLTDPVVLSKDQKYGATDGGQRAMENFFAHHKCNQYCIQGWKRIHFAQPSFTARSGTTFFRR